MKHARSKQNRTSRIATRAQRTLLPLVAVGGSLAGLPASALELGDLTVQSRLGQPLRASIAFALAPNEQLTSSCVTLGTGVLASGLPGIGPATISIAKGNILLTGNTAMREPMVAARVIVDCAYTANLSREYMLFIDPAGSAQDAQAVVKITAATPVAPARRSAPVATQRAPAARTVTREPIGKSTRYRVQPGDSLSRIAERIENRPVGLWPAATAIFDANPDAFMGNDPNRLKAGSLLTIPSFDGSEPVISVAATSSVASAASVTSTENVASTESPAQQNGTQTVASPETATVETVEVIPTGTASAIIDTTSDLSPADVVLDADNPFVDGRKTTSETIVIPDTELAGPTTSSTSPNVPTAVINTGGQTSTASTTSWLMWLTGGGIAIIIGLLLFGRLLRGRSDAPIADQPTRRATDGDTLTVEAIPPLSNELDDDAPTEENLTLDADLEMGTGLGASGDMEVASDFGFASPTEVDIELPFEPEPSVNTSADTNMLSPLHTDEQTILDSEVLPDDDNYDLSVILDATKMPQPEDITARDLQAVEVTPDEDTSETDAYTINDEVDLNILEQDYEDELTATQALNVEIRRAATVLAKDLGEEGKSDDETAAGPTVEMPPLASVTELDITAQMTARDENEDDADETGVHEAATIEMPVAENDDETTEMEVDGGKAGTKGV